MIFQKIVINSSQQVTQFKLYISNLLRNHREINHQYYVRKIQPHNQQFSTENCEAARTSFNLKYLVKLINITVKTLSLNYVILLSDLSNAMPIFVACILSIAKFCFQLYLISFLIIFYYLISCGQRFTQANEGNLKSS